MAEVPPVISPTSRLYLAYISPISPLYHLEHRGGGGPAPEVEQAEEVGPVAEVVEKVVLALLTEGVPAQADQQQALGRVPQVEVLRRAPD